MNRLLLIAGVGAVGTRVFAAECDVTNQDRVRELPAVATVLSDKAALRNNELHAAVPPPLPTNA